MIYKQYLYIFISKMGWMVLEKSEKEGVFFFNGLCGAWKLFCEGSKLGWVFFQNGFSGFETFLKKGQTSGRKEYFFKINWVVLEIFEQGDNWEGKIFNFQKVSLEKGRYLGRGFKKQCGFRCA